MTGPPLRWRLLLRVLGRLPQGLLSRAAGILADTFLPTFLRRPVIGGFARMAGVDVEEAEGRIEDYPSVGTFFSRRLRPGLRPWPKDRERAGSPVDGLVGALGGVREGTVLQAKGMPYSVSELLGARGEEDRGSAAFEGGWYLTLYLSPRHYHRIHTPLSAQLHEALAIPGRLLPVNERAVQGVPHLFPRNERLVLRMETGDGPFALVAVGAFNVGRISVSFDPGWAAPEVGVTNLRGDRGTLLRRYDPPLVLERGMEVASFHLGSTVILLMGPGRDGKVMPLAPELVPGSEIRVGEAITGSQGTRPDRS